MRAVFLSLTHVIVILDTMTVSVQLGLVAPIPRDTLRRPWPFDCRRPWRQTPFPWAPQGLTDSSVVVNSYQRQTHRATTLFLHL